MLSSQLLFREKLHIVISSNIWACLTFSTRGPSLEIECEKMTSKVDPRAEIVNYLYCRNIPNRCIQINRKEIAKTFMMISNLKPTFGLYGLYQVIRRWKG